LKILIVTQYYPPEYAIVPSTLAEKLVERGHDVRVLTSFPNYPHGRLFDGYRQSWRSRELDSGVDILRVPMFINHSQSAMARILNYLSFGVSTCLASSFSRGAEVVYVYASQMTAASAPYVWNRTRGIPYILHVQDLWPESITDSSIIQGSKAKKVIRAVLTPFLTAAYRRAAAVITIAPTMRRILAERGVAEDRLHTVFNWADESQTGPSAQTEVGRGRRLQIVYAGNLGDMQDLDTVVKAAALVRDLANLRIVFVGTGVAEQRLRRLAAELSLENIEFRGRISPEKMVEVYAESDFQLVTLKDIAIFRGTIPSKLQGSLARGVPIITNVAGDVSSIVSQERVGLAAPPEDEVALAALFREACSMSGEKRRALGENSHNLYQRSMSATAGVDAIEALLSAAAKQRNSGARAE
jgi:colanic acid biosynthesis glycosyl transferase WcaI